MKYRLILVSIFTLNTGFLITGCTDANNDMSVAKKILKPVINSQCAQELDQSKVWNISTYLMTESNKQQFRKEVCECVAEHALTDIPSKDLLRSMIDENVKDQVIQKAVLNSAKACILQMKE